MGQVEGSYLVARTLKEEGSRQPLLSHGRPQLRNRQQLGRPWHPDGRLPARAGCGHGCARLHQSHRKARRDHRRVGARHVEPADRPVQRLCRLRARWLRLGGAGPISDFGRGGFQEIDQASIFEPVSKAVMRPTQADRYPEQVSTAFRLATTGRPGPVYVDCNEDVLYEKVEEDAAPSPPRPAMLARPEADPDMVRRAVATLSGARSPIVLAGGGAFWSRAWDELRQFVDRTGIPFYTTPISRGLIPEDHRVVFPRRAQRGLPRNRRRPGRGHAIQLGDDIRPAHQPERQHHPNRYRTQRNRKEPVR